MPRDTFSAVRSGVRGALPFRLPFPFALAVCSLMLTFGLAGCGSNTPPPAASAPAAAPAAAPSVKQFHLEGTVVSVDKGKQQIMVDHKEIPGFMGAMTMPYPVAVSDTKMLDQLGPGDQITADVAVDDSGAQLHNIVVVKKGSGKPAAEAAPAAPAAVVSAAKGAAPDFTLLNQDGKRVDLARYRGKAVLLTFIYTRCPLPDYCPLMTHNFATIEKNLAQNRALYARTHLLSISFDPKFDTPQVLRDYAAKYGQRRFDHWELAALPEQETRQVASAFNLVLIEENGQINHSMCTAILSPDGSIYRLYHDNDWKPAQVLADLSAAAALSLTDRS